MKIWLCEIDTPKYTVTGVGATEAEAKRIANKAARKHLRSFGMDERYGRDDPLDYFGGNTNELEVGKAYLDNGNAGEVR